MCVFFDGAAPCGTSQYYFYGLNIVSNIICLSVLDSVFTLCCCALFLFNTQYFGSQ